MGALIARPTCWPAPAVREVVQEPGPVRGLVSVLGQLVLVLGQLVLARGLGRGDPLLVQRQVQQQPRRPLRLLSAPKPGEQVQ